MSTNSMAVRYAGERLVLRVVLAAVAVVFFTVLVPQIWSLFSPFIIATVVAMMLQPVIHFGQQKLHMKRGLVVAICLTVVVAAAFLLLYWFASFAVVQLINAANNAPTIIGNIVNFLQTAVDRILDMVSSLPKNVGLAIRQSINDAFASLSNAGMNLARSCVNYAVSFAASIPSVFIYTNFLILAMVFITNRYPKFARFFAKDASGEQNIRMLRQSAGKGMMGYIRVQLLFSMLTFLVSWVFFQAVGFEYAFLIGFLAALLELIPQFGCGVLYLPWSAICFVVGTYRNGWLVLGLYLIYSLLRRVTEPALLGTNLGVSPLASLVGMFVGMRVGGVIGLILGPVLMVVLVSAVRSHLFDATAADIRTVAAFLKVRWMRGKPEPVEEKHE